MNPGNQTNCLSLYGSMISLGFFRLFHLPDVVARSFLFSSHASFPPLFWLTNLRSLGAKLTVSPFLLADWLKSQKLVNFGSQKNSLFYPLFSFSPTLFLLLLFPLVLLLVIFGSLFFFGSEPGSRNIQKFQPCSGVSITFQKLVFL